MTTETPFQPRRLLAAPVLAAMVCAPMSVAAQVAANQQVPRTIPGLDNFSLQPSTNPHLHIQEAPAPGPGETETPAVALPSVQSPIAAPTPTPAPTVRPSPVPATRPAANTPRPSQQPRTAATPAPRSTPASVPATAATPTPVPARSAATAAPAAGVPPPTDASAPPTAVAPAAVTPAVPVAAPVPMPGPHARRHSLLWIPLLLALLLLPGLGIAVYFWRRGLAGAARRDDPAVALEPSTPAAAGTARNGAATPAPRRPQLELVFQPRRAGTNITSAAVDYELVVANTGNAAAGDIRVALDLFSAGDAHDADLGAFFEAPVARPLVAPFALAPGESRTLRAVAMRPKGAVNVVTVRGRPMFVPLVAVNALYGWGEGNRGQTASSHIVGIQAAEGERMRPFWLDTVPRMHVAVAERPHAVAVTR